MSKRNTRAPRGRPKDSAVFRVQEDTIPEYVGLALSHLAHIIDHSIELRGGASDARSFAARALGVPREQLHADSYELTPVEAVMVGTRFAELINDHAVAGVIGVNADVAPYWEALSTDDPDARYPVQIHAVFEAGTLSERAMVLGMHRDWESQSLVAYSAAADGSAARRVMASLVDQAGSTSNPFRARTVRADMANHRLRFRVTPHLVGRRQDVVLPAQVWAAVDRHVLGVFDNAEQLAETGLSTNRGVLLHGAPGVGKSAVVRTLAAELAGKVTIVLCDSTVVMHGIGALYEQIGRLSPALVVIDDFDRIAPQSGEAMRELLVALDGVTSTHEGVVTLATANHVNQLDPAMVRSSRFDAMIEVPKPDRAARRGILAHYLSGVAGDVDVSAVASISEGATGADLRDLVTEAVLAANGRVVTTALVRRLVRERLADVGHGVYL